MCFGIPADGSDKEITMANDPHDSSENSISGMKISKQRGIFLNLFPDTKLASEWYEGEFSISGGFAKSYLIGLGEMLEIGAAEKEAVQSSARELFEIAKDLSSEDADILIKIGWILSITRDNQKYSYVRKLLDVLSSWPVSSEDIPEEAPEMVAEESEAL